MRRRLIALSLVLIILALGSFVHIYLRTRAVLHGGSNPSGEIIAAAFELSESFLPPPAALRNILIRHRFTEKSSSQLNPGEFSDRDGALFLRTRASVLPDGTPSFSRLFKISWQPASIQNEFGQEMPYIRLAPLELSPLRSTGHKKRTPLRMSAIPKVLQDAFLAIEDRRFYSHWGIDPIGLTRAIVANIRAGKLVQGGSTITQQLAKNLLFTSKRSFIRKYFEALAALSLEFQLSKEEIFERYLNEVYFGQEGPVAIHGVVEASRLFFNKPIQDITLAEAALLAGLVRAPSAYAPRRYPERARARRNLVLQEMAKEGFIDSIEAARAIKKPLVIEPRHQTARDAEHFIHYLRQEILRELGEEDLSALGLSVHSTLSPHFQRCAEAAASSVMADLDARTGKKKSGKKLELGLVAIESYSGKIRAWVGSRSFQKNQYDHVVQAKRQIGSLAKPFVYLTAMDPEKNSYKTATTLSILEDKPLKIKLPGQIWEPQNYDRSFRGPVTLRYALENSLNVPTIYVLQRVGVAAVRATMLQARLAENIPAVPSIGLGTLETNLLSVTAAYAALANGGMYVQPRPYISVLDADRHVVLRHPITESRISSAGAAFVVTNILQGVIERGTGNIVRRTGIDLPFAGKTGTTDDGRDSWFIGYSPALTAGVWVGYDNNAPTGLTGSSGAARVWSQFVKCALPVVRPLEFIPPPDVQFVDVDIRSRSRATDRCPPDQVITEVFLKSTAPQTSCPLHPQTRVPAGREPENPEPQKQRSIWDALLG